MIKRYLALISIYAAGGCAAGSALEEGSTGQPELVELAPKTVLPGTRLVVTGRAFLDGELGQHMLRITVGRGNEREIVEIEAAVDGDLLTTAPLDLAAFEKLGGEGQVPVTVQSVIRIAGQELFSTPLSELLELRQHLEPDLTSVPTGNVLYVNDRVEVAGTGLLLPGEGDTVAVVSGCFAGGDQECAELETTTVPVVPTSMDRTRGYFVFSPRIAGIRAGQFRGQVVLRNRHATDGVELDSVAAQYQAELVESTVFLTTVSGSLGQYVDISGGGFVGADDDGVTLLDVNGQFQPDDGGEPVSLDRTLVPVFVDGRRLRWVLNEQDFAGIADLRAQTGVVRATLSPRIIFDGDEVFGTSADLTMEVEPIKQVVFIRFTGEYRKSLRYFGMEAADSQVRARTLEVLREDYQGINLDIRTEPPSDFALFSEVEIGGRDPNGLGLIGYDNTPGKDVGNLRLYDRLGGVNAVTQQDGYPGYGGVFIESLFVYSAHPAGDYEGVDTQGTSAAMFDTVFDATRPDLGEPARAADLGGETTRGSDCPGANRSAKVGCAIWSLGSLVGSTLSHEIGHSLGLADPYGPEFHNSSDAPNRIMDRGSARPFSERSQVGATGRAVFCQEHYEYLRNILPAPGPDPGIPRPACD